MPMQLTPKPTFCDWLTEISTTNHSSSRVGALAIDAIRRFRVPLITRCNEMMTIGCYVGVNFVRRNVVDYVPVISLKIDYK